MDGSVLKILLYAVGFGILGIAVGYAVSYVTSRRHIHELTETHRKNYADATRDRDRLYSRYMEYKEKAETFRKAATQRSRELETAEAKTHALAGDIRTLRAERENTKVKISELQGSLVAVHQRALTLQNEFEKAGKFYKRELARAFEKRKSLEEEVKLARADQEEFKKRVESSVLEHGSPEEMITAAQLRLGQIDVLERNIGKLEAENDELRQDATRQKMEFDSLQRELAEMEALRINNQQLVRCVESLEKRRSEHEQEAEQFREEADKSEKLSDTLRMKLNDLEKNFAAMEQHQEQAIANVRSAASASNSNAAHDVELIDLAEYRR